MTAVGVVLAAGAGTRFGGPKVLAEDGDWLRRAVAALSACEVVMVALGAASERARPLVPPHARVVEVAGWADGLSATLRAALAAAGETDADALVITTVDTPGLPSEAVERLLARAHRSALAQATYVGGPGHPVVIGRDHWAALASDLTGDRGARRYLRENGVELVDCADLWDGADVDRR